MVMEGISFYVGADRFRRVEIDTRIDSLFSTSNESKSFSFLLIQNAERNNHVDNDDDDDDDDDNDNNGRTKNHEKKRRKRQRRKLRKCLQYLLRQLTVKVAQQNAEKRPFFSALVAIDFSEAIQIFGLEELNLIQSLLQQLLQNKLLALSSFSTSSSSSSLSLHPTPHITLRFYGNSLTTQAIECLSLLPSNICQQNSTNANTDTDTDNIIMLAVKCSVILSNCIWIDQQSCIISANSTASTSSSSTNCSNTSVNIAESFQNKYFWIKVAHDPIDLETAKYLKLCFQKLECTTNKKVLLEFDSTLLTLDGFEFLQTWCRNRQHYTSCKLFKHGLDQFDGRFSLNNGRNCILDDFQQPPIDMHSAALLSKFVIAHAVQAVEVCDIRFHDSNIVLEGLATLLSPLLQYIDDYDESPSLIVKSVLFQNCQFHSAVEEVVEEKETTSATASATTTIIHFPRLEWAKNGHELKLELPPDEHLSALALVLVFQLLTEYPPFTDVVTALDLSKCAIGNDGMKELSMHFNNTQLTTLKLSCLEMTMNQPIPSLIKLITHPNSNLVRLHLFHCQKAVNSFGFKILFDVLQCNNYHTLRELYVSPSIIPNCEALLVQLEFFVHLNRLGRGLLLKSNVTLAQIAYMMERANDTPSCIFWILSNYPHYIFSSNNKSLLKQNDKNNDNAVIAKTRKRNRESQS